MRGAVQQTCSSRSWIRASAAAVQALAVSLACFRAVWLRMTCIAHAVLQCARSPSFLLIWRKCGTADTQRHTCIDAEKDLMLCRPAHRRPMTSQNLHTESHRHT